MGGDILGTADNQYAGAASSGGTGFNVISMSADGKLVVTVESGLGDIYVTKRVNIFKYDPLKTVAQPNSGLANFGPVNWSRVSTFQLALNQNAPVPGIALSADGKTLAIVGETLLPQAYPPQTVSVPTLKIYHSTDGGVTWVQRGLTLSDSVNGYDSKTISISANGLQVAVTTFWSQETDNFVGSGKNPACAFVYEWNGNAWVSTIVRQFSGNANFSTTISYDGKVVVTNTHSNDTTTIVRSHKNENGTWTNNAYTINRNQRVHRARLSADGSIMLITVAGNTVMGVTDIAVVEIYRWNGTAYVAVIGNNSIANRSNYWADTDIDAMLSADGTRLIVGHNSANADVYELVATNKFSYETSNSAVAELHGNIALFKSAGSSTITATQTTPAGNATIASELTVTEIIRAANGETIQYVGLAATVPTSTPLFIETNPRGSMEWFAVVPQSMKSAITNYESNNVPFRRDSTDPLTAVPLNNVVTTLMTDMFFLFLNKTTFNHPISSWDTSNVSNMDGLFLVARAFNQNIGSWNTSKVTSMTGMFSAANNFNQNISSWNTSAVIHMSSMFDNAFVFNQNLTGWDVDQVTSYSGFRNGSGLTIENTPVLFR